MSAANRVWFAASVGMAGAFAYNFHDLQMFKYNAHMIDRKFFMAHNEPERAAASEATLARMRRYSALCPHTWRKDV